MMPGSQTCPISTELSGADTTQHLRTLGVAQSAECPLCTYRCRSIGPRCGARFRGRHAITSAKRAVKIRQIPEAGIERYSADLLVGMEGIRQQLVRPAQGAAPTHTQ